MTSAVCKGREVLVVEVVVGWLVVLGFPAGTKKLSASLSLALPSTYFVNLIITLFTYCTTQYITFACLT